MPWMAEAVACSMHSVDVLGLRSAVLLQLVETHHGFGCMLQQPDWSEVCFGASLPAALARHMPPSDRLHRRNSDHLQMELQSQTPFQYRWISTKSSLEGARIVSLISFDQNHHP
jgi:hypothetical protein